MSSPSRSLSRSRVGFYLGAICNMIAEGGFINMKNRTFSLGSLLLVVLAVVAGLAWMTGAFGQSRSGQAVTGLPSTKNGEWPQYTADLKGTKYSPLDQINASNFNKLEVAWRFKTDSLGPRPEYKFEGEPL